FSPAYLQPSVVNHEALKVTQRVEGRGGSRVDEGNEADVFVGDVSDMVEEAPSDDVANFFDCGFGMDVAQVYSTVAQIVDATRGCCNSGRSYRLLRQRGRNHLAISARQHVGVARGDT